MSTPIRPPGGPSIPGVDSIEGAASVEGVNPGQAGEVSEVARPLGASSASPVESPTASVLARLQAGELTREQAVESLVAEALQAHGGARLPAAHRQELASVLRATLLDDPALAGLLG